MIPTKQFKLVVFTFFTLFTATLAHSQTVTQPEPPQELEKAVSREVARWENELSLSAKQMDLMERKFIEFALKREEVLKTDLPQAEKRKQLVALKIVETHDMRDILTGPQYNRYIELLQETAEE